MHYEAAHFPSLGTLFDIVLEDGVRHGLTAAWTIRECLEFATRAGFTVEETHHDHGLTIFAWHKPSPGQQASL